MTRFADLPSPPAVSAFVRWSEEKMAESIEATLHSWAPGQDVWIFGYGSLIWRPEFDFTEKRPAHPQCPCLPIQPSVFHRPVEDGAVALGWDSWWCLSLR